MAKPDKTQTEASSGGRNKTGLIVIVALALAALIGGFYFLSDDASKSPSGEVSQEAKKPPMDADSAAILKKARLKTFRWVTRMRRRSSSSTPR